MTGLRSSKPPSCLPSTPRRLSLDYMVAEVVGVSFAVDPAPRPMCPCA